jgi:hypothetical protein
MSESPNVNFPQIISHKCKIYAYYNQNLQIFISSRRGNGNYTVKLRHCYLEKKSITRKQMTNYDYILNPFFILGRNLMHTKKLIEILILY